MDYFLGAADHNRTCPNFFICMSTPSQLCTSPGTSGKFILEETGVPGHCKPLWPQRWGRWRVASALALKFCFPASRIGSPFWCLCFLHFGNVSLWPLIWLTEQNWDSWLCCLRETPHFSGPQFPFHRCGKPWLPQLGHRAGLFSELRTERTGAQLESGNELYYRLA